MYLAGSEILGAGGSGFEASVVGNDERGPGCLARTKISQTAGDSSI